MTLVRDIKSVWVPFEVKNPADGGTDETGNVCSDIPRFLHPQECKDFIQLNARKIGRRLIQFREHTEEKFKQEFATGIGREFRWLYGPPVN